MKKFKKIVSILLVIIVLLILFVKIVTLIDSHIHPEKGGTFFGWKSFIVLSGSMENTISVGDIVIVKDTDTRTLKIGDIIAFKKDDIVITHRIIDIIEDEEIKYVTKGDNNNVEDEGYVLSEQIIGVYKFKINGIGKIFIKIKE